MKVALFCYTGAFDNGPRNFELWSSDEDDNRAGTPSPNYYTTYTGESLRSPQIKRTSVPPTRRVFSGAELELMASKPRVRYLDC
ncbi:hypothetical protein TNCV_5136401 [Trichonephila clavipes]|nr:hypothetical protein TNCV_5136401 [Trichonephila clavipes]